MNIQQLRDRYGLKTRQSIYDWCKAANITLAKDEKNRAYATPEQIELFDQLSEHLANGGTLKNFTPAITTTIETVNHSIDTPLDRAIDTVNHPLDSPLELSQVNDLMNLVQAIAAIPPPSLRGSCKQ